MKEKVESGWISKIKTFASISLAPSPNLLRKLKVESSGYQSESESGDLCHRLSSPLF